MNYFKCKLINFNSIFSCTEEKTLLEAALAVGVNIPYRCGCGYCGLCTVKLISGEVKVEHSGGISQEDRENGFILPCCAIPKGNIEIETNEKP